ncbi:PREDICTED: mitochondrial import inner membrane translocase subunit Tim10 [Thamnophis sirtalis]|uniref:Mitochondrial import inner membrane translocase subunit n=1 Tax=Thamnophis sirtalis TaxID=35019 RepID=A0A6I9XDZ0_9SAUR|nr:PREDICTED: mitochondrial import inner membrane translocase subunit Tim10 [Thamnophis sirtalis]
MFYVVRMKIRCRTLKNDPFSQVIFFLHNHRMTNACHRKCVPPHYKEAELSKGESVCLDRCVSKYLDIHERMGKKLTELSMQDEELMKRMQQGTGPA